jgi:hypothetical protein
MTFAELLAAVIVKTNRPDLVAETTLAIQHATLQCHRSDKYLRDIYETAVAFSTSDYIQTLDYKALLPLWRGIKYLRKYDAVGGTAGMELQPISVDQTFDSYNIERVNVYYLAGSAYQIKCDTSEQYFLLGCYLNPNTDTSNFSSWVAQDYPFAIVYKAAASVCEDIGLGELAARYLANYTQELQEIRQDCLEIANF